MSQPQAFQKRKTPSSPVDQPHPQSKFKSTPSKSSPTLPLCKSWPHCTFDQNCKFFHPNIQTLAPGRQSQDECPTDQIYSIYEWLFASAQQFQYAFPQIVPAIPTIIPIDESDIVEDHNNVIDLAVQHHDGDVEELSIEQFNQTTHQPFPAQQHRYPPEQIIIPFLDFFRQSIRSAPQTKALQINEFLSFLAFPPLTDIIRAIKAEKGALTRTFTISNAASTLQCQTALLDTFGGTEAVYLITSAVAPLPDALICSALLANTSATKFFLVLARDVQKIMQLHQDTANTDDSSIKQQAESEHSENAKPPVNKPPRQRVPLEPNPDFKVHPINFVHGGELIQAKDGVEEEYIADDHSGNVNQPNNELPEKYRHMKLYAPERPSSIFLSVQEQVLKAVRTSYSMTDVQKTQKIQQAEALAPFRPSTTMKPHGWFPPYALSSQTSTALEDSARYLQQMSSHSGGDSDVFHNPISDQERDEMVIHKTYYSWRWLEKWGWMSGSGLTKNSTASHVDVIVRPERLALGGEGD